MFDIGFWELLIIGLVALLVVGPERLPAVATFAGHWIGRIRRLAGHMRDEIREELETEQLKNLVEEQNRELQTLREEVAEVREEAGEAVEQGRRAAETDGSTGEATSGEPGEPLASEQPAAGDDAPTGPR